jgi:hypothetical protein
MRDHAKLQTFKRADEVAMSVYRVTAGFPKNESYGTKGRKNREGLE